MFANDDFYDSEPQMHLTTTVVDGVTVLTGANGETWKGATMEEALRKQRLDMQQGDLKVRMAKQDRAAKWTKDPFWAPR